MHPLESIQLPPVIANDLSDVPPAGIAFAKPNGVHAEIVRTGLWKDRVRAYLAAVSYMDAQVGRLLDALEKSKQRDNTIILFVGDHGWHLGEKEHWAKCDLWREGTRTPMIWVAPGLTKAGTKCERAVDLTSIFPTVCELTGVPTPQHAEGVSLKPLLAKPTAKWKQPAISTFLLNNHAISTDEWRYIRYADGSEELYNEKTDPHEWVNQAANPKMAKIKGELASFLPKVNATPVPSKDGSDPESAGKPHAGPKGKKKAKRNKA
jgi:arylsulfatase A-like enzyme